jgi:hypothetical protein
MTTEIPEEPKIPDGSEDLQKASEIFAKYYEFPEQATPTLRHYTTAAGLAGIIESKSIFATHIQFLNDTSEVIHSAAVAERVFDECTKQSDPVAGLPAQRVAERGAFLFKMRRAIKNQAAFVTSFCEDDDLLSQWRGYAMEGFAVGLDSLDSNRLANPAVSQSIVRKVIYQYSRKKTELLRIVTAAIKAGDNVPHGADAENVKLVIQLLSTLLLETWAHTVKHQKFEEEREWRIVSLVGAQRPALSTEKDDFFVRVSNGQLIPTIRLRPKTGLLPISRITCGPNSNRDLTEKGVRMLLEGCGYGNNVQVQHSQIPFRPRY